MPVGRAVTKPGVVGGCEEDGRIRQASCWKNEKREQSERDPADPDVRHRGGFYVIRTVDQANLRGFAGRFPLSRKHSRSNVTCPDGTVWQVPFTGEHRRIDSVRTRASAPTDTAKPECILVAD